VVKSPHSHHFCHFLGSSVVCVGGNSTFQQVNARFSGFHDDSGFTRGFPAVFQVVIMERADRSRVEVPLYRCLIAVKG